MFDAFYSAWVQVTPRDLDAAVFGGGTVAMLWLVCSLVSIFVRRST